MLYITSVTPLATGTADDSKPDLKSDHFKLNKLTHMYCRGAVGLRYRSKCVAHSRVTHTWYNIISELWVVAIQPDAHRAAFGEIRQGARPMEPLPIFTVAQCHPRILVVLGHYWVLVTVPASACASFTLPGR